MPDTISNSQPKQVLHELDVILVYNPDIDCDDIDTDEGWAHKDYFQVRWGKQPHRVLPGKTKRMPRFLANHFAKHLANHVLMRMEEETGRKGLIQSPVERPRVLSQILSVVDEYYLVPTDQSEGQKVSDMVDNLNPQERTTDVGVIPNPLLGVLKQEGPSLDQIMKSAGKEEPKDLPPQGSGTPPPTETIAPMENVASIPAPVTTTPSLWDESKPKPARSELLKEAYKMGIDITGRETVDELIGKLKKF